MCQAHEDTPMRGGHAADPPGDSGRSREKPDQSTPRRQRVRGASLPTEAVNLGFWAVIAQMLGLLQEPLEAAESDNLRQKAVAGAVAPDVREQIKKRYDGETDAIIAAASKARSSAQRRKKPLVVSLGTYERERRLLAEHNSLSRRPGSAAWPPGAQTVAARLGGGSWANAMSSLGLEAEGQGRPRGSGKLTERDFRAALSAYMAWCGETGSKPTYAHYCSWARGQSSESSRVPSGSTIRQRFGTWSAALTFLRS